MYLCGFKNANFITYEKVICFIERVVHDVLRHIRSRSRNNRKTKRR